MDYIIPQYDDGVQMAIGGFCSPSVRLMTQVSWEAAFKDAAELGLTYVYPERVITAVDSGPANAETLIMDFARDPKGAMRFLDLAAGNGLKVWFEDSSLGVPHLYRHGPVDLKVWDTAQAREYTRHPAFGAIYFMDEPRIQNLPNLKIKYAQWRQEFPGKPIMSNIVQGGGAHAYLIYKDVPDGYRKFVNDYINMLKPDCLYFAHYTIKENGTLNRTYFCDLALIGAAAKKAGIPAGAYILTTGHSDSANKYKSMPSARDLRWQIACMLAFGHKSFSHYAIDPPYGGYQDEKVYDHFYTDGKRNSLWYAVQTVNREVLKWDHVYLNFNWLGTAQVVGDGGVSELFDAVRDGIIKPDKISGVKSIKTTRDLLIGVFRDAGKNRGFMVTNASNPAKGLSADIEIQFGAGYKGVQVFKKGVPRVIGLDKGGGARIGLESGEGKFLIPLKGRIK